MTGFAPGVALVTGGSRGIGRAAAFALAGTGARVAIMARCREEVENTAADLRAAGHQAIPLVADVSDDEAVRAAVTEAGPVDVLVNNAGVTWPLGPTAQIDPGQWMAAVSVNLGGALRCIRQVLPGMLVRGWGRIVNVTTGAARPPGMPRANAYSVSKAGLYQLTVNLAAELDGSGVAVAGVDPGTVDTAMQDFMRSQPAEVVGEQVAWMFRRFREEGQLRDPAETGRLITAAAAVAASGEIIQAGTNRADQILQVLTAA